MAFIDDLYGSVEKDNGRVVLFCGLLLAGMSAVSFVFVFLAPVDLVAKIMVGYGAVMASTAVTFIFSSYFFRKRKAETSLKERNTFFSCFPLCFWR